MQTSSESNFCHELLVKELIDLPPRTQNAARKISSEEELEFIVYIDCSELQLENGLRKLLSLPKVSSLKFNQKKFKSQKLICSLPHVELEYNHSSESPTPGSEEFFSFPYLEFSPRPEHSLPEYLSLFELMITNLWDQKIPAVVVKGEEFLSNETYLRNLEFAKIKHPIVEWTWKWPFIRTRTD